MASSKRQKHTQKFIEKQRRYWRNRVKETKTEDGTKVKGRDHIKAATKEFFKILYKEEGGDLVPQDQMITNIPNLINKKYIEDLMQQVNEDELYKAI